MKGWGGGAKKEPSGRCRSTDRARGKGLTAVVEILQYLGRPGGACKSPEQRANSVIRKARPSSLAKDSENHRKRNGRSARDGTVDEQNQKQRFGGSVLSRKGLFQNFESQHSTLGRAVSPAEPIFSTNAKAGKKERGKRITNQKQRQGEKIEKRRS